MAQLTVTLTCTRSRLQNSRRVNVSFSTYVVFHNVYIHNLQMENKYNHCLRVFECWLSGMHGSEYSAMLKRGDRDTVEVHECRKFTKFYWADKARSLAHYSRPSQADLSRFDYFMNLSTAFDEFDDATRDAAIERKAYNFRSSGKLE
jgi:hypothetical protein